MNFTTYTFFGWPTMLVLGLGLLAGPQRALAQRPYGIDVYSGSGSITWSSVKNSGIDFAWAKASEGYGYTDSQIVNNINNARAAGVLVGAYHFARYDLGNSAVDEANWFWSVVSPYIKADGTELMPMLDVEVTNTLSYSETQISDWVNTWCQTVVNNAAAAGITVHPVIYTYCWYADTYLNSTVTQWPLWMATLNGESPQTGGPCLGNWSTWAVWQYSWTGVVPGVPGTSSGGYCDEDVFNGTLDDLKLTLVIGCNATAISGQPQSQTACQGGKVTFNVAATGTALSYQWQKNGGSISAATASSLTLSSVTTNDNGTYTVQISNSCGATTNTTPATLVVPIPPAITTQPQPASVCQGGNVTFSVTATGTPLNYQWQFNGTNLSATLSSYTLSNVHTNKAGSYTVIVSNLCGVVTSAVAALTVPFPPGIAGQPASQIVTQGANVSFCVTAAAGTFLTYQWQFNGTALSGASSCYSLGNVHANKAGPYWAVLTNSCGALTSSVAWLTLVVPPVSQTATQGDNVSFTVPDYGADPSLTWQWQMNGTNLADNGHVQGSTTTNLVLNNVTAADAGSYAVIVSNSAPSSAVFGASLAVLQPPYIIAPPQSLTITQGDNAVFGVTAGGTAPLSYQWQKNGTNIGSATTTALTLSGATTNDAGSYAVLVSNGVGSPASASASLTVLVAPYIITPPQSLTITQDGTAVFTVAAGGTAPLSYQWQKNGGSLSDGGNVSGASSTALTLSNTTSGDAGSYTIMVSNGVGSQATAWAALTVLAPQPPRFNSIGLQPDGSVQFSMSGTPGTSYVLECTSNWLNWASLATLADTNGVFQYNDSSATNDTQRFYRLRTVTQ